MASRKASFGKHGRPLRTAGKVAYGRGGGAVAQRPAEVETGIPRAVKVAVRPDRLVVEFADGSANSWPLDHFPRLLEASPRERENYELIGGGTLIHWPDVDEDIDVPILYRTH
jgi:uncharacterized protein DUF2442